jgi:hypothetical protein
MKILRTFPKTVQGLIDPIIALPRELVSIIQIMLYEISKNLPEEMLREKHGAIFKDSIALIYINRFNVADTKLKTLSRKIYTHLSDIIPEMIEHQYNDIFKIVLELLDSNSYDDRISAANALQELSIKLIDEDA